MDENKKKTAKKVGLAVALGVAFIYILFAIVHFNYQHDNSLCRGVEIVIKDSSDITFVHRGDVERIIKEIEPELNGKNLDSINTTKIERTLTKQLHSIKTIECYKTPDSQLQINIWQKHPILRITDESGRSRYLDSDGELMPDPGLEPAYVPIASGVIKDTFATNSLYKFAMFLRNNEFWNSQIEQIYVKPNCEVTLVPRVGKQIIEMGKLDNFEEKLDKLDKLYQDVLSVRGWNNYKEINLKFDKQVICTKK